jgi:hypothetical protein
MFLALKLFVTVTLLMSKQSDNEQVMTKNPSSSTFWRKSSIKAISIPRSSTCGLDPFCVFCFSFPFYLTPWRHQKPNDVTTGNWLFADCNFLCQLFFLNTRQRGPFANWKFLQSAKQDLPTAWLCRLPGSWQSHGFADCQAVGKELQSAKAGHG